jgi:hypothetical protein
VPDEPLLTVADVSRKLGIGIDAVLAHVKSGRLKAANVGAGVVRPRWRIAEADLMSFLSVRIAAPPAARRRRKQAGTAIEFF